MQIKGNTFIVTGGLGGLGIDCVSALLQRGANVAVFDLLAQPEAELKMAQLFPDQSSSVKLLYLCVDICKQDQTMTAVQRVVEHFGNLNGLVHCAAVALRVSVGSSDSDITENHTDLFHTAPLGE